MDQKRLILAAFLSLLVLLAWSYFFQPPKPEPLNPPPASALPTPESADASTAGAAESTSPEAGDAAAAREAIAAAAEQRVEVDTKRRPRGVLESGRAGPLLSRQRRHRSRRPAPRDGARARGRALPVRVDRSFGSTASDQRRAVRGRGSRARADRHQPGRSLRVQRRRRRRDQGVSLPRERTDRGGHPPRRQAALGAW